MTTAAAPSLDIERRLAAFEEAERRIITALAEMREITLALARPSTTPLPSTVGESVFITHLRDGEPSGPRPCTRAESALWAEREAWDLIINEITDDLRISDTEATCPRQIYRAPKTLRGWLWLALTHIGGKITHGDIARLFDLPQMGRDDRIHQVRAHLNRFLGRRLACRIFAEGKNRVYPVLRNRWSFLWIRSSADPCESELLTEDLRERVQG